MATMITDECINCGACEPECPNTAIYQGGVQYDGLDGAKHAAVSDNFFYIVPEKCTECVGFYDHEACAAVCPVDCCVPNPDIPESEAVLIQRAREIHPDKTFTDDFPSRFKGGAEAPEASATPAATPAAAAAAPAPAVTAFTRSAEDALADSVPPLEDWEVPLVCFRCSGQFEVPFEYLKPGTVLHCPHCIGSFVPNTTMYQNIAKRVLRFYESFEKSYTEFRERRAAELDRFADNLRSAQESLRSDVRAITENAELAGAKQRNRGFFG
jgi:ferredoxin